MSENERQICRLCFNAVRLKGQVVDEIIREMLDVLLLKLDLNVIGNPIVCQNCAAIVQRSFSLKSACIHTEILIVSFAIDREQTRFELKDMIHKNGDMETCIGDVIMCRFCMNLLEKGNFDSMDILIQEKCYTAMLATFMPEMDLTIIKNSAICTLCRNNLGSYFKLVRNYFYVEEKKDEITNIAKINLNMSQFALKERISINKREPMTSEKGEDICAKELINIEEILDIKEDVSSENSLEYSSDIIQDKCEASEDLMDYKDASEPDTTCSYVTKHTYNMKRHELIHKNTSQKDMYKCVFCAFETKWKNGIKRHMLIHKGTSEVNMYECSICSWKTKYKSSLKQHMLMHKDPAQLEIYKCSTCSYETKYKYYIKYHALVHKDTSEVKKYKCTSCGYETRHKQRFKRHAFIHKDISEGEMHRCALCPYMGKQKAYLKKHMLVHKDPSELQTYRCSICSYEATKLKNLQRHMLSHRNPSEVETYKCPLCSHEIKHKRSINRHMLTHKAVSEVKMYKCSACDFQTKYKCSYKTHFKMVHKEKSE